MERKEFLNNVAAQLQVILADCSSKRQPTEHLISAILNVANSIGKQGDYAALKEDLDVFCRQIKAENEQFKKDILARVERINSEYNNIKGKAGIRQIANIPKPRNELGEHNGI